jgi:adenosylmethionine-8-amino-7-oxononanoate aminotransferase
MILALDVKPSALKNANTFPREMFASSLDEGVLIRPIGNTIYVMPPYVLSAQETKQMGQAVQRAMNQTLND